MKKNKVWRPFFQFYTRFRIPWHFYVLAALLGMVSAELVIKVSEITIQVNSGELTNSVIIAYALFGVISAVVMALQAVFTDYGAKTVTMRSQSMLWRRILHLPQKNIDKERPSELISCVTNDVEQASSALSMIFLAASSIYAFARACAVFIQYNGTIAFYMLAAAPVAILVFFLVGRLEYKSLQKRYEALNVMTAWFSEHLAASKYVKVQGLEEQEVKMGQEAIESRYRADIYYVFASQFQVILNSLYTNLSTVILAFGGSSLIRKGQLEANGINASSAYVGNINRYMAELLTDYQVVKGTQGSLRHVNALLDLEAERLDGGEELSGGARELRFENVNFGYDEENLILKDVSFTIPQNKKTAIIGGNGSGKSTVLKLLQGFYAPNDGTISIGGVPLDEFSMRFVRGQFVYVLQNTPLFSGTIRDNITYGVKGEISQDEVIAAAKQAEIHEFVLTLPQGYDTLVSEMGTNLSGGQRQRIAIARALITKPRYLILDEATASLDYQTANQIMRLVQKRSETVIYISHDMEEVRRADHVIVMNGGRVEACGTLEEVGENSPTYRSFVEMQTAGVQMAGVSKKEAAV